MSEDDHYIHPDEPNSIHFSPVEIKNLTEMRQKRGSLISLERNTTPATYSQDLKNLYQGFRLRLIMHGTPTGNTGDDLTTIIDTDERNASYVHLENYGRQVVVENQQKLTTPLVLNPKDSITHIVTAYTISPVVMDPAAPVFSVDVTERGKTPHNTTIVLASYTDSDTDHQEEILATLKRAYAKLHAFDMTGARNNSSANLPK